MFSFSWNSVDDSTYVGHRISGFRSSLFRFQGPLNKYTNAFKGFQPRYFVLDGQTKSLLYFMVTKNESPIECPAQLHFRSWMKCVRRVHAVWSNWRTVGSLLPTKMTLRLLFKRLMEKLINFEVSSIARARRWDTSGTATILFSVWCQRKTKMDRSITRVFRNQCSWSGQFLFCQLVVFSHSDWLVVCLFLTIIEIDLD